MKIHVKVYEEIKNLEDIELLAIYTLFPNRIEWLDNNSINTPYLVTVI